MDQYHSSIPQWAHQQPPPTAAPYSVAAFPSVTAAAPPPPPNLNYASQHQLPNFAAAVPTPQPPPQPTDPSPAQAPEVIQQPPGFNTGDPIPSYAQMIISAIAALKEPDGSSKRAITKYIDHFYPGLLPPALLTQTLQQMKTNGMLVMVKKSYKLPGSDFTSNANDLPDLSADVPHDASVQPLQQLPQTSESGAAAEGIVSSSVAPKRGRGRPPKPKLDSVLSNGHQPQPFMVSQAETDTSLPPGFAPNGQPTSNDSSLPIAVDFNADVGAQAVNVPIGLAEETNVVKRRPGRPPKKLLGIENSGIVIGKRGRGRPPMSGLKKRSPGRLRKPKPKTVAGVSGANGHKRRPGRPPKNSQAISVMVPYDTTGEAIPQESAPRPRGRPRKGMGSIAAGVGVVLGLSDKLSELTRNGSDGGGIEPRRFERPVGRPRKYADESGTESDTEEDFREKLQYLQQRVRAIVAVLKPELPNGAPETVVAAVGELEILADLDIDKPVPASTLKAVTAPGS